jgi:hypothetical protein
MNDKPRKSLEEMRAEAVACDGGLGLVCPSCGWTSLPVLYTRRLKNNETARVRQCRRCRTKVLCKERIVGPIGDAGRGDESAGSEDAGSAEEANALTP